MVRRISLILVLLGLAAGGPTASGAFAQETRSIEEGRTLCGTLASDSEHDFTLALEEDGTADRATLDQAGATPMTRIDPSETLTPEALRAYEGRYWSEEMRVAFELVVEDGELVARNLRLPDITLDPGAPDRFGAGPVGTMVFQRAGNGTVIGFTVDNGRTKGVWFARDGAPGR